MGMFQKRNINSADLAPGGGRGEAASSVDIASHDPEKAVGQQEERTGRDTSPRPIQFDAALEKRVVRKIDVHLIPLVMILCAYGPPP